MRRSRPVAGSACWSISGASRVYGYARRYRSSPSTTASSSSSCTSSQPGRVLIGMSSESLSSGYTPPPTRPGRVSSLASKRSIIRAQASGASARS